MRKVLANSIFQAILRLVIAIFLEIFKDNLYSALSRSLQLFVMVHPRISAILYRIFSSFLIPFTPIFELFYGMFMPIVTPFVTFFVTILRLPLLVGAWSLGREILFALFSVLYGLLSIPLGIIYSMLLSILKLFAFTLWKILLPFVNIILSAIWKIISAFGFVQMILSRLQSLIPILYGFIFRFFQPLQLAGSLVIPIARLVSKLLPLFPRRLIDLSLRVAKKIGGENRFVSDEELAILNLITVLSSLYVFCFIIGGYLVRLFVVICQLYGLEEFLDTISPFSPEEMVISWRFDGQLHEIGLVFFFFFTVLNIILYVIWRVFSFFFGRVRHLVSPRNSSESLKLSGEREEPIASVHELKGSYSSAELFRLSAYYRESPVDPLSSGIRRRTRSFTEQSVSLVDKEKGPSNSTSGNSLIIDPNDNKENDNDGNCSSDINNSSSINGNEGKEKEGKRIKRYSSHDGVAVVDHVSSHEDCDVAERLDRVRNNLLRNFDPSSLPSVLQIPSSPTLDVEIPSSV